MTENINKTSKPGPQKIHKLKACLEYESCIYRAAEGAPFSRGGMDKEDIRDLFRHVGVCTDELFYLEDYRKSLRENLSKCIECNTFTIGRLYVINPKRGVPHPQHQQVDAADDTEDDPTQHQVSARWVHLRASLNPLPTQYLSQEDQDWKANARILRSLSKIGLCPGIILRACRHPQVTGGGSGGIMRRVSQVNGMSVGHVLGVEDGCRQRRGLMYTDDAGRAKEYLLSDLKYDMKCGYITPEDVFFDAVSHPWWQV